MKPGERKVAGLWCSEVLAGLSDYLDGELTPDQVNNVNAHLSGCDWCERFGGAMQAVVTELRGQLSEPAPLDDEMRDRLWERLKRAG